MSIKFPPHVTYREAFGTDHQKTYRGRGSEVQKKYSRKGKLKEKKFMHAARKFPTPTPPPPITFLMVCPLELGCLETLFNQRQVLK